MIHATRRRARASVGATAICIALVPVLSACGTVDDDPYSARITEAQAAASSEFEHTALADGRVDRAEYEEAMQRFVECMSRSGVEVGLAPQAGYFIYEVSDIGGFDSKSPDCRRGSNEFIEPLYVDILTNPDNLDPRDAIARCLVRHDVVPDVFTGDDFGELSELPGGLADIPPSSEWSVYELDPAVNPAVDGCLANPNS